MAIIPKPRIVAFDFVFVSGYCPSIIFREAPYGSELYLNKFLFSRGAPIPKWLLKNILQVRVVTLIVTLFLAKIICMMYIRLYVLIHWKTAACR